MTQLSDEQIKLAEENYKIIHFSVWRWVRKLKGIFTYEEIYDACMTGFISAVKGFDESRGFRFTTLSQFATDNAVKKMILRSQAKKRTAKVISLEQTINTNGKPIEIKDVIGQEDSYFFLERDFMIEAWTTLTEKERKCLHLYFYEEQTQTDIAREIGCSQVHVSRVINKALQKMRKHGEVAKQ